MKRKATAVVLFCVVLLAAIVAGYFDMLNAEKLRIVRDKASDAVGEIAAIVRSAREPAAETAAPDSGAAGTGAPPAGAPSGGPRSEPAPGGDASESTARLAPSDAAPGDEPAPVAAASLDAAAPGVPTFDILRVEPDGSTVLAGRAPAGTAITLLDGETPIGSETADADGAFVVVLEERLAVGDHQIRIVAKHPDGRTVASKEVAIVSIPEAGRENELLAMVEAPDRASRLISVPTAPSDAPRDAVPMSAAPEPDTAEAGPALSAAMPETAVAAAPAPTPPAADLVVEAVEIEDDTIYVAGRSSGGAAVRVYIDNGFLAEDRGLADRRFLVTAEAAVAIGEHVVRADALDAAGKVVARVEVPFFKSEGRAMSAISSPPPGAAAEPAAAMPGDGTGTAAAPSLGAAVPTQSAGTTLPAGAGDEIAVTRQPALEAVGSRVIIRRGDTLWRISRETYGLGRRYTVIYLANGDQIRDPDRIYPGQVFRVPEDEDADAGTGAGTGPGTGTVDDAAIAPRG